MTVYLGEHQWKNKRIAKEVDLIYWIYWIIVPWSQCMQKTSAPPGSRRGWQSRQRPTCLGKSSSKDIQLLIFDIFGGKKHHRSWKSIPGLWHWPKIVSHCFTYHISCYQVSGIRYQVSTAQENGSSGEKMYCTLWHALFPHSLDKICWRMLKHIFATRGRMPTRPWPLPVPLDLPRASAAVKRLM